MTTAEAESGCGRRMEPSTISGVSWVWIPPDHAVVVDGRYRRRLADLLLAAYSGIRWSDASVNIFSIEILYTTVW